MTNDAVRAALLDEELFHARLLIGRCGEELAIATWIAYDWDGMHDIT